MLLQYFGFRRDPFATSPDPRFLYLSHTHREAVASLEYGFLSSRGFTVMIAPPGMGKTTLLFRCLEKFRESARTAFLFDIDSECEPREFLGYILRDIGITPAQNSSEMHEQLTEALIRENRAGRRFVIVIDEAQNLSDALLERIRLLTNFETSRGKLMHIVLSGQPQLADKLMQASLLQLRQRISTVCRLEPLSTEETRAYIDYRLKQAGYEGEPLIEKGALTMIAEASHGIPRNINNLCFNALSLCCALKSKQVGSSMVSEVIADLQLIPQAKTPVEATGDVAAERLPERKQQEHTKRRLRFWIPAASALLAMCVLGIIGFAELRMSPTRTTVDDRAPNLKVLPASVPAPAATNTRETMVAKSSSNTAPVAITVEPGQSLQDISEQYLGAHDLQRLRQIQALNPKLTDPDHIEVGQKIWLPGPPPVSVATNTTPPASARKLP
jgi:general secretion pathway protein A